MIVAIILSVLCGGIIGIERKLKNKSAGLKTLGMISLGSTLFTLIAMNMPGDPSRIVSNIVTGIGFLGAGVIFRDKADHVSGLTTAAIVWLTAALGILCGLGMGLLAILLAIAITLLLILGQKIENFLWRADNRSAGEE